MRTDMALEFSHLDTDITDLILISGMKFDRHG